MGIVRKIIGFVILGHVIPLLFLLFWFMSGHQRAEYHWYIPFYAGYLVDIIIVVFGFLFILSVSLLEED